MVGLSKLKELYELGKGILRLRDLTYKGAKIDDVVRILREIRYYLGVIELPDVSKEIGEMEEDLYYHRPITKFELNQDDAKKIQESIDLWEERIIQSIDWRPISLPRMKLVNESTLRNGVNAFFEDTTLKKLPDICKSDLQDGWRCLISGHWTPATFMLLRATESVTREYYKFKTEKTPIRMGWNTILQELINHKRIGSALMHHLNYIREKRNEAGHPDKIFEQRETEQIFTTVISAISEIVNEMR